MLWPRGDPDAIEGMVKPALGDAAIATPLAALNDAIIACAFVMKAPWLIPLTILRIGGEPCVPFSCAICCAICCGCWIACWCCAWDGMVVC